jgi:hypothetical protein
MKIHECHSKKHSFSRSEQHVCDGENRNCSSSSSLPLFDASEEYVSASVNSGGVAALLMLICVRREENSLDFYELLSGIFC